MMMHHFWRSLRLFLPGSIVLVLMACVQGHPPKAEIVPKSSLIKSSPRSTEQSKTIAKPSELAIGPTIAPAKLNTKPLSTKPLSTKLLDTNFMIFGGGGAPSYNEIAIEKNIFYFQRTLKALSPNGNWNNRTHIWFANGNDGRKTVRYIDGDRERFKAPTVTPLIGSATRSNLNLALKTEAESTSPLFFYFTGHGSHNLQDEHNNSMILWDEQSMPVRQFTTQLDAMPTTKPFVAVMVQCYSGSFANLIYQGGTPQRGIAMHDRCGFFATVKSLPSVGCTPEVNEADYQDYSSSFFAGLSGVNRVGKKVSSADYDEDGRISFREAHAFAKIDEQAQDLPVSTLEVWLQERLNEADRKSILSIPTAEIIKQGRPEQVMVVRSLSRSLGYDQQKSDRANRSALKSNSSLDSSLKQTYSERITMELLNIMAEKKVKQSGKANWIAILEKLLNCEGRSL
ncbi:MAG: Caspase domain-containing protein [Cyanobacteria bacterium]|nr:Caspase domain-containing protein [Cyanobacteriota bacterium]